ncbi:MAG TPA: MurR/RpiR family transcriptional regulator [Mizugakiibacter sp.]
MSALVKIRAERDRMSAVERRIADFILENAQLLRDYSSQQLANALGISQSSVVKFTQKLGFKGYPDLKYAVGEAIARADNGHGDEEAPPSDVTPEDGAAALWRRKSEAEAATRLINPPETLHAVVEAIARAGKSGRVFVVGLGEDDVAARGLALRLALLGMLVVHDADATRMSAAISAAGGGDVLLLLCEHGHLPALCKLARHFRERHGQVITVTRHSANPLRALADIALVVSAHDEQAYVQPLLYQSALQHLLDGLFVRLCEDDARRTQLLANLERAERMQDP